MTGNNKSTVDKKKVEISPEILDREWTNDKNAKFHSRVNYLDRRFKTERTVFGRDSKDLEYIYSDQLYVFDSKPEVIAFRSKSENEMPQKTTAAWYEKYLQACYEQPVELVHIIGGCNKSDGYSYLIFGIKTPKDETINKND